MTERVARSKPPTDVPCPARHCWVADAVDGAGLKRPGLLIEWRESSPGHWEGRVIYAAQVRTNEWGTVEEWVAAALLAPA